MWKIANVVTEPTFELERNKFGGLRIQMFKEIVLDEELMAWMGNGVSGATLLKPLLDRNNFDGLIPTIKYLMRTEAYNWRNK